MTDTQKALEEIRKDIEDMVDTHIIIDKIRAALEAKAVPNEMVLVSSDLLKEAAFLCDRLDEFDPTSDYDIEYMNNVDPSHERLKALVKAAQGGK